MSEPVVAVVVAAGLGLRFGGTKPKPTLRIRGRAVVSMALEGLAAGGVTHAVVVVNGKLAHLFQAALAGSPIPVVTTAGGDTRQQSVLRGLDWVRNDPVLSKAKVILVHDAVRPMMPAFVIEGVIRAVHDGAVAVAPAIPVSDSIRMIDADEAQNRALDRSRLRAIQTPQGFDLTVLLDSHDRMAAQGLDFTDDVTCCEMNGHPVKLVPGSRLGIKITEPADLTVARALWRVRASLGHHSGRRFWRSRRKNPV
ncbi:MAG: 2-C-methyl-D-erythritol 4-phosphate cytidylyltransferase [Propionicimonas sp.]